MDLNLLFILTDFINFNRDFIMLTVLNVENEMKSTGKAMLALIET